MAIFRELTLWGAIFLGGWGRFLLALLVASMGAFLLFLSDAFPWRIAAFCLLVGLLIVGFAPVPVRAHPSRRSVRAVRQALRWTRIWGIVGLSVVNAYLFGPLLDLREYSFPTEIRLGTRSEPQFFLPGWYDLKIRPDQNLSPVNGPHLERFYSEKLRMVGRVARAGGEPREFLLGFDSKRSQRHHRLQVAVPRWLTVEWSPDARVSEGMQPSLVFSRHRDKGVSLSVGITFNLLLLATGLGGTVSLMVFALSNGFESCGLD